MKSFSEIIFLHQLSLIASEKEFFKLPETIINIPRNIQLKMKEDIFAACSDQANPPVCLECEGLDGTNVSNEDRTTTGRKLKKGKNLTMLSLKIYKI